MQKIWKKQLKIHKSQIIELPDNAKILCVQIQKGIPCIWFIVPQVESYGMAKRKILCLETDEQWETISELKYIGTFQMMSSTEVFHLFEER